MVVRRSTAYLLTERLTTMPLLSAALGALASVVGMAFSYTFDIPSGATIVLASAVLFALAFFFDPRHGLFWRSFSRKQKETAVNDYDDFVHQCRRRPHLERVRHLRGGW